MTVRRDKVSSGLYSKTSATGSSWFQCRTSITVPAWTKALNNLFLMSVLRRLEGAESSARNLYPKGHQHAINVRSMLLPSLQITGLRTLLVFG